MFIWDVLYIVKKYLNIEIFSTSGYDNRKYHVLSHMGPELAFVNPNMGIHFLI
jgi:hypothetical protein